VEIHPHAFAAAAAAEAAALQGRFWEMHELLFHRQKALRDDDLQGYATQLELDVARFDQDRFSPQILRRIRRDVESEIASGEVRGTPTLFIDGVVHSDDYDVAR
jgi:protein-disulfide isomerase